MFLSYVTILLLIPNFADLIVVHFSISLTSYIKLISLQSNQERGKIMERDETQISSLCYFDMHRNIS